MKKVLTIALIMGLWSVHGQEIVRKGGESTGVDAEVRDLVITPGYVADLEDWRFGFQLSALLIDEIDPDVNVGNESVQISPQLSISKRLGGTNYFAKTSLGYAQDVATENKSGVMGVAIRWDTPNLDYILFQRTLGFEVAIDGYFGYINLVSPSVNGYTSVQLGQLILLDATAGLGYCRLTASSEPGIILKFGLGINIGGGI